MKGFRFVPSLRLTLARWKRREEARKSLMLSGRFFEPGELAVLKRDIEAIINAGEDAGHRRRRMWLLWKQR